MSTKYDEAVEAAWERFEERLMEELAKVDDRSFEVGLAGDGEVTGAYPYVQIVGFGDWIRAEVSSNEFLDPAYAMVPDQERRLVALGWERPEEEQSPNWWVDVPREASDTLLSMVTGAFRLVFGVEHPRFLDSDRLWPGAEQRREEVAVDQARTPQSREELEDMVAACLRTINGAEVEADDDGDYPIFLAPVPIWVRVHPAQPVVRAFTFAVDDVTKRDQALIEAAILSKRTPLVKFSVQGDMVMAAVELPATPFVAEQLRHVVADLAQCVCELADDLALRVGGSTFVDSVAAARPEDDA